MIDSIERGWSERTVTVNRSNLIEKLYANREQHQKDYAEALAGYKEQATAAARKAMRRATVDLADAEKAILDKIARFDPEDPVSDQVVLLQAVSFRLPVPQNHSRAYDVAIKMAEWEVADTIEITQSQFQCFVLDDWDWKRDFTHLNKTYSNRG